MKKIRTLALETSTQLGSVCLLENDRILSEHRSENQKSHSDFLHQAIEIILQENSLQIADVDLFATGIGPGSFTGLRIAVNAAKSFSYILKKPVAVIDSLTLLAQNVHDKSRPILTLINAYKNMNYSAVFQLQDDQCSINSSYKVDQGGMEEGAEAQSLCAAHADRLSNDGLRSKWNWYKQLRAPEAVSVRSLKEWLANSPITQGISSYTVVGDGYKTYLPYFDPELLKKFHRPELPQDFPLASTLGLHAYQKYLEKQTMDWKFVQPLYIRASEAEENKRGVIFTPLN